MRLRHVFLPALLMGILLTPASITSASGQTPAPAPKPAVPAAPKPASPVAPKPAIAPKPAVPGAAAVKPAAPKPATAPATGARPAPRPVAKTAAAAAPKEMTDEQKTIYALGLSIARSLKTFSLSPAEMDVVKQALTDSAANKPAVELETWGPKIQGLSESRAALVTVKEKEASNAYCAKAATEPGAKKTASGLVYKELTPGTGASPVASDTVKVHYRGTLIDGTEFDSSYKRNEPATFPLGNVIKGWTEGVQLMKVGGKSILICPSDIAYGDQGRPSIPGGAALIFEIELLEIVK